MTQGTTPAPRSPFRPLAILGFIGLIVVIAWLSIQIVKLLPSAFSSLASLADSVYRYQPATPFTVTASHQTVTNDEVITLHWDAEAAPGSFALSYDCVDGLSLDIKDALGSIRSLSCQTNYNLGNVTAVDMLAYTTAATSTVTYHVDFIPSGKDTPAFTSTGSLSLENTSLAVATTTDSGTATTSVATSTPITIDTVATSTPPKPVVTTPKPATQTKPTVTYTMPVSDPHGSTDLAVTALGVGTLSPTNQFVSASTLFVDTRGAIKFEVKNIGTKTSPTWTYTAKLPSGETYTAPKQEPLKPNERAVVTIGFTAPDKTGTKNYTITVTVTDDANKKNNHISTTVKVVN